MSDLPPVYYNKDSDSFAFETARVRWIKIVQDTIEDINEAIKDKSQEFIEQGQSISKQLSSLKSDIQNDGEIKPFLNNSNIKAYGSYNEVLQNQNYTWLSGPWLILENYLYRLINSFFLAQPLWFNYDIFNNLKKSAFESSVDGVSELAVRYYELSSNINKLDSEALKILFTEFTEISLWGNATDLSLLATATLDDIKSIQGAEARKKSEDKILSNDLSEAWNQISQNKGRVDFVLDNTGFELYTDLIFALFLIETKLSTQVNFHTKDIPWMVSDVNIKDFYILIDELKNVEKFPLNRKEIDFFINKVEYYNNIGVLNLQTSSFWTLDKDFYEINPSEIKYGGADLYKDLLNSKLIIFKGDMNYRKLTGDRRWDPTTKFINSIGPLASQGLKILSLRTVKADVLVGLPQGVYEKITEEWGKTNDNKLSWLYSGKYAVISYSNGDN
ncbi:hypothetical protein WICMUC_005516 [Wickerhamomyces mucosus]|uniref:Sugar phosphate phosphatase n=1 Tax=Wickerhamomyces mucosus TaxID=1378264 RepID=A0A9P8P838_9ASCO|nr:hypothetical protein WICMUC_005516 [Wickerhamomyces mucosus]